jgi:hypothetical protein
MGGTFSMREEGKFIGTGQKTWREETAWEIQAHDKDNIEMDLKNNVCGCGLD